MLDLQSPTRLRLTGHEPNVQALEAQLRYVDKKVDFALQKLRANRRWVLKTQGEVVYKARLAELQASREKSLLFKDDDGLFTYSGLLPRLQHLYEDRTARQYTLPEEKLLAYANEPTRDPRYYQVAAEDALIAAAEWGPAGVEIGCHRRGEEVLTFDGSLKRVEDVVVGDRLMGPDSKPRTVLELRRGVDTMYRVRTSNGQDMYVNGHHILSLRRTRRRIRSASAVALNRRDYRGDNPLVTITVEDYLRTSEKFKHLHKLYSVPVDFPATLTPTVAPYFVGLYLGDGNSDGCVGITSIDPEVISCINETAELWGVHVETRDITHVLTSGRGRGGAKAGRNALRTALTDLGVFATTCDTKRIPHHYKCGSRDTRRAVLAGLIDSDGSLTGGCYDYISKSPQLAADVAFIARSLGLRASLNSCTKRCRQTGAEGTYYRVILSGDLTVIPVRVARKISAPRKQKKAPTSFSFTVDRVSDSEAYYGFVLDSDHLYLTDSFLVTHNTGLGKTFIILRILKRLGLPAVIMSPSTNIAEQIFDELTHHFGKAKVGFFGDGKKDFKKQFTVAIGASLTRIEEGSPAWKALSQVKVFVADESHMCPAQTLSKVCFGLLANVPYRFFFSGTQIRNDGLGMLLESITGPIVYRMTVRDGVDQGFLSKPVFRMCWMDSNVAFDDKDANEMTRAHIFYNPEVNRRLADFANKAVSLMERPTVILVDEFEQLSYLLPHLRYEARFAHGGVTKENKAKIPEQYHDSDPKKLVQQFNRGEYPILVGTSCIATGTDIQAAAAIIYLRGGKSEIEVKQSVGRGTRLFPGKTDCIFLDVGISNIDPLKRHALARRDLYEEIYPSYREIRL